MSEQEAIQVPPGGGDVVWLAGDVYTLKLPRAATGGAPPPHVHYREDETFAGMDGMFAQKYGFEIFPPGT